MMVISAEELLKTDTRPPVLYLRSFIDDNFTAQIPKRSFSPHLAFGNFKNNVTAATEEEILANQLSEIGPPVAVGKPGEKLPELGIARLYFNDDIWESEVRDLMAKAQLVVLRAGDTHGTLRELEMVSKHLDPRKLLLLVPYEFHEELSIIATNRKDRFLKFKEKADKLLPRPIPVPDFYGKAMVAGSLSGVIWFDAEWSAKSFSFADTGKPIKESLAYFFEHHLTRSSIYLLHQSLEASSQTQPESYNSVSASPLITEGVTELKREDGNLQIKQS